MTCNLHYVYSYVFLLLLILLVILFFLNKYCQKFLYFINLFKRIPFGFADLLNCFFLVVYFINFIHCQNYFLFSVFFEFSLFHFLTFPVRLLGHYISFFNTNVCPKYHSKYCIATCIYTNIFIAINLDKSG